MGLLTPSPKAPRVQTIVQRVPVVVEDTKLSDTQIETQARVETEKRREENLLRRSRGRFGTILTGFRGILENKSNGEGQGRRTLLGE